MTPTPVTDDQSNPPDSANHPAFDVQVRDLMDWCFTEGGLRDLCLDLGVDPDNLPGSIKQERCLELVEHCKRRDRFDDLTRTLKRHRSDVAWDDPGLIAHYHAVRQTFGPGPAPAYIPPPPPDPTQLVEAGELGLGSYVPYGRNHLFTGREDVLVGLARSMLHGDPAAHAVQAVQGIGGVGKTQLAVEFAHRFGRFFYGVHWISAAQPDQIEAEIATCGEAMRMDNWPDKPSTQAKNTLYEWRRTGPRLVILDNLEDVATARQWLPQLSGSTVRLLITTRRARWPKDLGLALTRLKAFSPQESYGFLRRHLPHVPPSDGDLARLARRLRHLALALELAAQYLGESGLPVDTYLDRLENIFDDRVMKGWMEEMGSPTGHSLNLAETFAVSYQPLAYDAKALFWALGLFAPVALELEHVAAAVGWDEERTWAGLHQLVTSSLVRWEGGKIGQVCAIAHPVLHEFAAHLMPAEGKVKEAFRTDLGRKLVKSMRGLARRDDLAQDAVQVVPRTIRMAECIAALGSDQLPRNVLTAGRDVLRWLAHDEQLKIPQRRAAALALLRLRWLTYLEDLPLDEMVRYLDLIVRYVYSTADLEYLEQRLSALLNLEGEKLTDRPKAQLLAFRAGVRGRLATILRSRDLLKAANHDYQEAKIVADRLTQAEDFHREDHRLSARVYLGLGNITQRQGQLVEAVGLYLEAAKSARTFAQDTILAATVDTQLGYAYALLHDWEKADRFDRTAADGLQQVKMGQDQEAYVRLRALYLEHATAAQWERGTTLVSQAAFDAYRAGLQFAQEEMELLREGAELEWLANAHFNAGDCLLGMSTSSETAEDSAPYLTQAREQWTIAREMARHLRIPDLQEDAQEQLDAHREVEAIPV